MDRGSFIIVVALAQRRLVLRVGRLSSAALSTTVVSFLIQIRASASLDNHASHTIRSFTTTLDFGVVVGEDVVA